MKRLLSILALLALAIPSHAGTITRGTKASGGTDFQSGFTIDPDEVNTDFNTVYTVINGNIESANLKNGTIVDDDVNTSAAVQPSKIDDHADSDANYIAVTSPGSTGSLSKPTNLEGDLQRLRYAIKRLATGTTLANATSTWIDNPFFGPNLLYHGSFEATDGDGDNDSTSAPVGWSVSGTTPTFAYTTAAVSNGSGLAVQITSNDSQQGITQTLSGLKASTTYLLMGRVNNSTGSGGCELKTTGGDTNASDNDSSGSYATVVDLFATDSTPTDVVVALETNAGSEVCDWDAVGVYEVGTDPIPHPGPVLFTGTDTTTTGTTCATSMESAGCSDLSKIEIIPPGPGYIVSLTGFVTVETNSGADACEMRIAKADTTTLARGTSGNDNTTANVPVSVSAMDGPLTPGVAVVYEMDVGGAQSSTDCDVACDEEDGCILKAILMPPGV